MAKAIDPRVTEYKLTKGPRRGVVLFEVKEPGQLSKNFDSYEAALAWLNSPWPRLEPVTGRLVTSDGYSFPANTKGRKFAAARQKNLGGK